MVLPGTLLKSIATPFFPLTLSFSPSPVISHSQPRGISNVAGVVGVRPVMKVWSYVKADVLFALPLPPFSATEIEKGLWLGSIRDSFHKEDLLKHQITHILTSMKGFPNNSRTKKSQ
uniref:Uncharacterized protein n=1 Tax=Paramoeba aestuarina TaxID=180227 RepID=A0A7S4P433_9EUKA|mmetsp:Transcript_35866/g.56055  ORF Transcript_35866/g.56055 Transcript_35866/m.56055 type:complete len:117 (+) Transcript_35866:22-372(+)